MSFLTPLFLAAAAAVAVPVLVHLFHLRSGRRRTFPALRYLRRTEREHARRIRLRQILLLVLRVVAVLLLVAAGARLVLPGSGASHEPTALALVLDNSLSSGAIVGDERVLDDLKRRALAGLDDASAEDRIWVIRAGQPWQAPVPVSPGEARRRITTTEPRGAALPLHETVERARSLVASAGMPAEEVHLVSDLQATALPAGAAASPDGGGGDVPVLILGLDAPSPANRHVSLLEVGGGLPPLQGRTTRIGARVDVPGDTAAGDTVRVRLMVDGRMRGAADALVGSTVLLTAGPFAAGEVTGAVEIDPDALRMDDRRHFAFTVRPPPRVASAGDPGLFLDEALSVLAEAGRIRRTAPGGADVLLAAGGEGVEAIGDTVPAVILPPDDPALLPALNRRLRDAGVPWRLAPGLQEQEVRLRAAEMPISLDQIRVNRAHDLVPAGEETKGRIRVRRSGGEPWMVATAASSGRPVLLLGSPLLPEATSLPVSPDMLPLVEWMVAGWPPGFRAAAATETGTPLRLPSRARRVRAPDGTLHRVDGRQPFQATGIPGVYEVLDGDSVLTRMAVNPPTGESHLERLGPDEALRRIRPPARLVEPEAWSERVFLERRGSEPWRALLLAALVVLLIEGAVAAAGGAGSGAEREARTRVE